jgi:hypothetical protein
MHHETEQPHVIPLRARRSNFSQQPMATSGRDQVGHPLVTWPYPTTHATAPGSSARTTKQEEQQENSFTGICELDHEDSPEGHAPGREPISRCHPRRPQAHGLIAHVARLLLSASHVECGACFSDKLPRRGSRQSNEDSATVMFILAASARWGLNGSRSFPGD